MREFETNLAGFRFAQMNDPPAADFGAASEGPACDDCGVASK
jgi:hypothetical protein